MRSLMPMKDILQYLGEQPDPVTWVQEYYESKHRPLTGFEIFHLLEPLAGTQILSFLTDEIRMQLGCRRSEGIRHVDLYAQDIFLAPQGLEIDVKTHEIMAVRYSEVATTEFYLPSTEPLRLHRLFTHSRLAPDEALLHETRTDALYTDTTYETLLYASAPGQWTFYKGGYPVHTIPIARLWVRDAPYANMRQLNHIPDGYYSHRFYDDERQTSLNAFPREHQLVSQRADRRSLYISSAHIQKTGTLLSSPPRL